MNHSRIPHYTTHGYLVKVLYRMAIDEETCEKIFIPSKEEVVEVEIDGEGAGAFLSVHKTENEQSRNLNIQLNADRALLVPLHRLISVEIESVH